MPYRSSGDLHAHRTLSRMEPSLKRRSSAFSPQKERKAVAAGWSLAGGPWSTNRREDSGSMRKPRVSVVGVWGGEDVRW